MNDQVVDVVTAEKRVTLPENVLTLGRCLEPVGHVERKVISLKTALRMKVCDHIH